MNDTDFIREVEELYLRLANADTDDLVELAKLAGLNPTAIHIEMVKVASGTFAIGKYPVTQEQYEAVMGVNPSHFQGNPRNPVESVSYDDAVAFCKKLSQLTGKNYRLPTESEWEYACRAGTTTDYCFGNDANQLEDYAWYYNNSEDTTHPVGQKKPNTWGIYDMHGNVWEYCQKRVNRGGSWGDISGFCRSATRDDNFFRRDYRSYYSGFRVAVTIS